MQAFAGPQRRVPTPDGSRRSWPELQLPPPWYKGMTKPMAFSLAFLVATLLGADSNAQTARSSDPVAEAIAILQSDVEASAQCAALVDLRAIGGRRCAGAIPRVVAALCSGEASVRNDAGATLLVLVPDCWPEIRLRIDAALTSPRAEVRQLALDSICFGAPASDLTPWVLRAADDPDRGVQAAARTGLRRLPVESLQALLPLLGSDALTAGVASCLVDAILSKDVPGTVEGLQLLSVRPSAVLRQIGVQGFWRYGEGGEIGRARTMLPALLRAVDDDDETVARLAEQGVIGLAQRLRLAGVLDRRVLLWHWGPQLACLAALGALSVLAQRRLSARLRWRTSSRMQLGFIGWASTAALIAGPVYLALRHEWVKAFYEGLPEFLVPTPWVGAASAAAVTALGATWAWSSTQDPAQ